MLESVRMLGRRALVREHRAPVSSTIIMLEYENSTWEVVSSSIPWLRPSDLVIIDRLGEGASFLEVLPHCIVIGESAVIAYERDGKLYPAPGIVIGKQVPSRSTVLAVGVPKLHSGELLDIEGRGCFVVGVSSGWYLKWRGEELRAVREHELLAELSEDHQC